MEYPSSAEFSLVGLRLRVEHSGFQGAHGSQKLICSILIRKTTLGHFDPKWFFCAVPTETDYGKEWVSLDSNQGPTDYESAALTN